MMPERWEELAALLLRLEALETRPKHFGTALKQRQSQHFRSSSPINSCHGMGRTTSGRVLLGQRPTVLLPPSKVPQVPDGRPPDTQLQLQWAYGFNGQAVNAVQWISETQFVFCLAALCVVETLELRRQRIFVGHSQRRAWKELEGPRKRMKACLFACLFAGVFDGFQVVFQAFRVVSGSPASAIAPPSSSAPPDRVIPRVARAPSSASGGRQTVSCCPAWSSACTRTPNSWLWAAF